MFALLPAVVAAAAPNLAYRTNAPTPPMGWNSWDIFGTTVTEEQIMQQADAMAEKLLPNGWQYLTVDIQWYEPNAKGHVYQEGAPLQMDEYSRLTPALTKFPSAAEGAGFKPLADYVHSKGLKFGIHIMRGISRQAVKQNMPIIGTAAKAADIALTNHTCPWNPDMYGVDMSRQGAQEYYDSIFALYASWGVDFVKVDDISRPYDDVQKAEIEAIRKAIDKTGRPIVLSLSPGDTPIERGSHVMNYANMWRISDDFWDRWLPLRNMFGRLEKWSQYRAQGAWPDADMLPFGFVEFGRPTRFTKNEQRLCMSLWCIARSPLIFGGDMTRLDEFTVNLLANSEVLAVNQASENNRQISRDNNLIVWAADVLGSSDKYVALFNAQSENEDADFFSCTYKSPLLDAGRNTVGIAVSIKGKSRLTLAVSNADDNFSWDHAVWVNPLFTGAKGTLSLTDLKWTSATAGWGRPMVNRTCEDKPLEVGGKSVEGIGTHAESTIVYDIPEGYDTFSAIGALTTNQGSIRFGVLAENVSAEKPESSEVSVAFSELGLGDKVKVRDLWEKKDVGVFEGEFGVALKYHQAGLYRLSPQQ
jgi:hypothetical protein